MSFPDAGVSRLVEAIDRQTVVQVADKMWVRAVADPISYKGWDEEYCIARAMDLVAKTRQLQKAMGGA